MKNNNLYFNNIIVYKRGANLVLNRLLLNSLFLNTQINPSKRFIYSLDSYYCAAIPLFSNLKLSCFMTTSRRVPSSCYFLSRFFLVKYIDNLSFGGIINM